MRGYLIGGLILAGVLGTTGCSTKSSVADPGGITLEEAMGSVGRGFAALKRAEGNDRTGLVPETVTVTFNIAASQKDSKGLYIDLNSGAGMAPVSAKAGGTISKSYSAQRGNQITITFKNLLFANPSKTLLKNPEAVQAMLNIVSTNQHANYFLPH